MSTGARSDRAGGLDVEELRGAVAELPEEHDEAEGRGDRDDVEQYRLEREQQRAEVRTSSRNVVSEMRELTSRKLPNTASL